MNEADTRAVLIDPSLKAAGWSDTQVTREYFYQRDYKYTDGRILVVGNQHRRATSRKADYLLRYTDGTAIAVIEAKADVESAETGLEQAKGYAKDLGLNFAYSSNGRTILEYDFFTHSSRELDRFPNPQDLWNRWTQNTAKFRAGDLPIAADLQGSYRLARQENPLLHSYCPESLCGKRPHYFQEVAIREVIKRFMWGQRRALLALATVRAKRSSLSKQCGSLSNPAGLKGDTHNDQPGSYSLPTALFSETKRTILSLPWLMLQVILDT